MSWRTARQRSSAGEGGSGRRFEGARGSGSGNPRSEFVAIARKLARADTSALDACLTNLSDFRLPQPGISQEDISTVLTSVCRACKDHTSATAPKAAGIATRLLRAAPVRIPASGIRPVLEFMVGSATARLDSVFLAARPREASGEAAVACSRKHCVQVARDLASILQALGYVLYENGDRCGEMLEPVVECLATVLAAPLVPDAVVTATTTAVATETGEEVVLGMPVGAALAVVDGWLETRQAAQVCVGNLLHRGGSRLKAHHPALYTALWQGLRLEHRLGDAVTTAVVRLRPVELESGGVQAVKEAIASSKPGGSTMQSRLLSSALRAAQMVLPSCAAVYRSHLDELLRILHSAMSYTGTANSGVASDSAARGAAESKKMTRPTAPGGDGSKTRVQPPHLPTTESAAIAASPNQGSAESAQSRRGRSTRDRRTRGADPTHEASATKLTLAAESGREPPYGKAPSTAASGGLPTTEVWRSHSRIPCNPPTPERRRGPGYETIIDASTSISMDAASPLTPSDRALTAAGEAARLAALPEGLRPERMIDSSLARGGPALAVPEGTEVAGSGKEVADKAADSNGKHARFTVVASGPGESGNTHSAKPSASASVSASTAATAHEASSAPASDSSSFAARRRTAQFEQQQLQQDEPCATDTEAPKPRSGALSPATRKRWTDTGAASGSDDGWGHKSTGQSAVSSTGQASQIAETGAATTITVPSRSSSASRKGRRSGRGTGGRQQRKTWDEAAAVRGAAGGGDATGASDGGGTDWLASSDGEGGSGRRGLTSRQTPVRVRTCALGCIHSVAKASPGLLHPRLGLFLPQVQALHPRPYAPSLFTVLLFDAAPKAREAAAEALAAVLDRAPLSKWIALPPITGDAVTLGMTTSSSPPRHKMTTAPPPGTAAGATSSHPSGSSDALSAASRMRIAKARAARAAARERASGGVRVTTASDRTKAMVREAHKGLVRSLQSAAAAIASDTSPGLCTAVLRTTATLLGVTPYDRLKAGLASSVAEALKPLVQCRQQAIVVPALQCVGALVTAKGCLSEVHSTLYDAIDSAGTPPRPGLLRLLAELAEDPAAPAAVRAEVLAALSKTSRHYARALSLAWPRLAPVLAASFGDAQATVRSSGLRVLEELLRARAAEAAALGGAEAGAVAATARTTAALNASAAAGGTDSSSGDGLVSKSAIEMPQAGVAPPHSAPLDAALSALASRGAPGTGQFEPLVPFDALQWDAGAVDTDDDATPTPHATSTAAAAGKSGSVSKSAKKTKSVRRGWPSPHTPVSVDAVAAVVEPHTHAAARPDALPLTTAMAHLLPRAMRDPAVQVRATACTCVSYLLPADWQAVLTGVGRGDAESSNPKASSSSANAGSDSPMWVGGSRLPSRAVAAVSAASWGRGVLRQVLDAVHAACGDDNAAVRAAGCRVLGAYSAYAMWKHPWFARQAAEHLLKCVSDDVLNVRARAAWGLGCICAAPSLVASLPPTLHAAALSQAVLARRIDAPVKHDSVKPEPVAPTTGEKTASHTTVVDPAPTPAAHTHRDQTPSSPAAAAASRSPLRPVSASPSRTARDFSSTDTAPATTGDSASAGSTSFGGFSASSSASTDPPRSIGSSQDTDTSGRELAGSHLVRLLGPSLLRAMTASLIKLCDDNDRVAASAARTLGLACAGLLALPSAATTAATATAGGSSGDADLVQDAADVLCRLAKESAAASAKTRWNACYALGVSLSVVPAGMVAQLATRSAQSVPHRSFSTAAATEPAVDGNTVAAAPSTVLRRPHLVLPGTAVLPAAQSVSGIGKSAVSWPALALSALEAALCSASHFKVRIAAAQALGDAAGAVPSFATPTAIALIRGIVAAQAASDFTEYRYKSQLEAHAAEALQRAIDNLSDSIDSELRTLAHEHKTLLIRALARPVSSEAASEAESAHNLRLQALLGPDE